jgi:hypothetical protein
VLAEGEALTYCNRRRVVVETNKYKLHSSSLGGLLLR